MLALDHLTVAHALPEELIAAAAAAGFDGVGLFLRSVPEVPSMPRFDLIADAAARRACRQAAIDAGCAIAIAYPFTITPRSTPAGFVAALDAAADLGVAAINVLIYDQEGARRTDTLAGLAEAARMRSLALGIEFFPPSAVADLAAAVALCDAVAAGNVGVTLDLLHLARSGGDAAMVRRHRDRILFAQICDATRDPPDDLFAEASSNRLLPGEGVLDLPELLDACGSVACSIEAPVRRASERAPEMVARRAMEAFKNMLV